MDLENFFIGIGAIIVGIFFVVYLTNERQKGDKGGYGAHINIYFGALGFIIIGLVIFIKELLKVI